MIISNAEIYDILETIKSLEESGLLINQMDEAKKQRHGFPGMLLNALGVSLLENLLTIKGLIRAGI